MLADLASAVRFDPGYAAAYNDLAWLLATCPEAKLRDGPKAVANATRACELSAWADAAILDTLAAAHAECGRFDQAVIWSQRAVELAPEPRKAAIRAHGDLYRQRSPYRTSTP